MMGVIINHEVNMYNGQLELGLGKNACHPMRRSSRARRSQWWFDRMRQIVESAPDWRPCPPGRPEQMWFAS
jgi:hypothetical protein